MIFSPPPFFIAKRDSPLRCHSINISREHRAFLDVGDAEEAGSDTLQADGEAAVRRHAVFPAPLCASLWPPIRPRRDPPRAKRAHRPPAAVPLRQGLTTPTLVYPARLHKICGLSLQCGVHYRSRLCLYRGFPIRCSLLSRLCLCAPHKG